MAGHAGLFSTIGDLVLFMTHFQSNSEQIVRSDVWRKLTMRLSAKSTRALGWDTKSESGSSAGPNLGSNSYGRTGYTGTSISYDPDTRKGVDLADESGLPDQQKHQYPSVSAEI